MLCIGLSDKMDLFKTFFNLWEKMSTKKKNMNLLLSYVFVFKYEISFC